MSRSRYKYFPADIIDSSSIWYMMIKICQYILFFCRVGSVFHGSSCRRACDKTDLDDLCDLLYIGTCLLCANFSLLGGENSSSVDPWGHVSVGGRDGASPARKEDLQGQPLACMTLVTTQTGSLLDENV